MRRTIPLILALLLTAQPVVLGAQTASAATDPLAFTLKPGDMLKVEIWREPDLGGEFLVDSNGMVVLPLLGEQQVTETPIGELRDELIEAYRVHLRNPSINITPLRRINVLGEVRTPGVFPVDPTTNLAGVIALAGGATPTGDLDKIRIVRDGRIIRERVGAGETLADADVRSGDQVIVEQRSWFERNSNFVISTTLSLTGIIIALLRRRD